MKHLSTDPYLATVMDLVELRCYERSMRAFVCEFDTQGLRRVMPEHILSVEELSRLAHTSRKRPTALLWALLDEPDADALRVEVGSGRTRDACGLLLNRAVELLPIAAALPELTSYGPISPQRPNPARPDGPVS